MGASGKILKEKGVTPASKSIGSARSYLLVVRAGAPPPPLSEVREAAKFKVKRRWKHSLSLFLRESLNLFRRRFLPWTFRKPFFTSGDKKPQGQR